MFHGINWGVIGGWAGIGLSAASAIGYAFSGDVRRALYFFFACCITVCVVWR